MYTQKTEYYIFTTIIMKHIITLLLLLCTVLTLKAQDLSTNFKSNGFDNHLSKIIAHNTVIRENFSAIRQTSTIKLDSFITSAFVSDFGIWYQFEKYSFAFYPNGIVKTSQYSRTGRRNKSYFDRDGYLSQIVEMEIEINWWENTVKQEFLYDSRNNQIEHKFYTYIDTDWELESIKTKAYDSNNNLLSETNAIKIGSSFIDNERIEYAYDANNRKTKEAYYTWHRNSYSWLPVVKTEIHYDPRGNQVLKEQFSGKRFSWAIYWKEKYSYTPSNYLEMQTDAQWDTTLQNWVKKDSTWKVYNTNHLIISDSTFQRSGSKWKFRSVQATSYNPSNQIILEEERILKNGYPFLINKTVSTYNSSNRMLLRASYHWNGTDKFLTNSSKSEYTYSNNSDIYISTFYSGRDTTWITMGKVENYYDPSKQKENIIPHNWFWWGDLKLLKTKSYSISNNQWEIDDTSAVYYSDFITSVKSVENDKIKMYPNPTTDFLNISGEINQGTQLELVNMAGAIMHTYVTTSANPRIDVSGLIPGVYFLRVQDKEGVIVKKILKQ